jgi:iron complex outermembrane receptor protein
MKQLRYVIGGLLAALWIAPLRAQQPVGTVRGGAIDDATRQPLAGVTVTVGARSAVTQADGRYIITIVPAGTYTLRARMLGYAAATESVTVVGGQEIVVNVALTERAVGLSEIVVTGYGEQRAGDITGAVKEITSEGFNLGTIINPLQLIENKVAGVQVVPSSNEPGASISVRIRGQSSVNASSEPLYVIDGVPLGTGAGSGVSSGRDPLNFLNSDDIESITVLKDASAAAIYGANAANGVVIIATKSGRGMQISYSGSMSASSVSRLPASLNADQFRAAVHRYAPQNDSLLGTANTNWFNLVDRTAFGQEHSLAIALAGLSSNYRLTLGYGHHDGVVRGTSTERLSLGLVYDQRLLEDRLHVRANVKGSRSDDQFTPGGVIFGAAVMAPTQPVKDTSATGYAEWPASLGLSTGNPVAILALALDHGTTYRSVGNALFEYRPPFLEALKAKLNVGYDVTTAGRSYFYPSNLHYELAGLGGEQGRMELSQTNTLLEAYLDYAAPLNVAPGTIALTGGYSYGHSQGDTSIVALQGLSTNVLTDNGFPKANTVTNLLSVQESKLISFFGRLNYNLDDRYLVAFSVRRDGSSRFGPANAWGTFPSLSFAWRISGESFMRRLTSVSDLKVRASWGRTGNQAFANYQQYPNFVVGSSQVQYQFGDQFVSTIRPSAVDPNIRWEETSTYNVGLDFGVLSQTIQGTIDWYVKKTKDLIFTVPVAAGTNFSNFLTTNIGSMRNQGIELSLSARVLRGGRHALGWTADFTAARNANKLVSINPYGGAVQQIGVGFLYLGTTIQVLQPGIPINSFFVCRQYYRDRKPVENTYLSLVGDSVIQGCGESERRPYHDPAPKWTLGHTSYLSYGNFELSFTLRAWLGNYVYNFATNSGSYVGLTYLPPNNVSASALKTGFTTQQPLSDYFVEDASFLRMDNVTVGYSFRYHGQPMRVFATVQNVFTITGYSGVDPTAGLNGLDSNVYPRSRTFTAGLSVRL